MAWNFKTFWPIKVTDSQSFFKQLMLT
jgi:hypothetical protein